MEKVVEKIKVLAWRWFSSWEAKSSCLYYEWCWKPWVYTVIFCLGVSFMCTIVFWFSAVFFYFYFLWIWSLLLVSSSLVLVMFLLLLWFFLVIGLLLQVFFLVCVPTTAAVLLYLLHVSGYFLCLETRLFNKISCFKVFAIVTFSILFWSRCYWICCKLNAKYFMKCIQVKWCHLLQFFS